MLILFDRGQGCRALALLFLLGPDAMLGCVALGLGAAGEGLAAEDDTILAVQARPHYIR